ncbi:hypothetical protein GCM10020219_099390 [Nonomuraea dietziae]
MISGRAPHAMRVRASAYSTANIAGLRDLGPRQGRGPLVAGAVAAQQGGQAGAGGAGSGQQGGDVLEVHDLLQQVQAFIERLAEGRFVPVQVGGEPGVLLADPGEQEGDLAALDGVHPAEQAGAAVQRGGGCAGVGGNQRAPVLERLPSGLQGVGHVREPRVRLGGQVAAEAAARLVRGGGAAGRDRQHLVAADGWRRVGAGGRLLDHHVHVGAAPCRAS